MSTETTTDARCTRLADAVPHSELRGTFRIGRSFHRISQRNDPYRVVELLDGSGVLRCYAWNPSIVEEPIAEWSLADVWLWTYRNDHGIVARLNDLAPTTAATVETQLLTLPTTLCPVPGVVERLVRVVMGVQTPLLREFVARVFADADLARGFFRVPASFVDHHAWPGGTAEHSVEMATNVQQIAGLSDLDRDLAVVGSLFHDIGKVETHDRGPEAFELFKTVGHDALTLYLLAGPLRWLTQQWPSGACALLLGWVGAGEGSRLNARVTHPVVDVVRAMDRVSRVTAIHRVHFATPGGFRSLSHGRVLWSPVAPAQSEGGGVAGTQLPIDGGRTDAQQ